MFGDACLYINDAVKPCTSYIKGGYCTRNDQFRCIEFIRRHEPTLSFTSIKDYAQCHRKFYLAHVQGLEPIEKNRALTLGSLAAIIIGMLHASIDKDTAVNRYKTLINAEIEKTIDPEDGESVGDLSLWAMKAMFDAYIENDIHSLKGVTEKRFLWNEPGYPRVKGFIDLVDIYGFGHEFKYTQSPDWYDRFTMQDQLSSYFVGDPEIIRFDLHLLAYPTIRFKKSETITQLYERTKNQIVKASTAVYFIHRSYWREEFDLNAYKNKAKMVCEEIMKYLDMAAESNMDPMYPFYQDFSSCKCPFECDFIDICRTGVVPYNLFRKKVSVQNP